MDALALLLRLLHIVFGVFWAGTLFFFVTFLEPSVRAAGPPGGQVMLQLRRRRYLEVLPAVAVLTIITGLILLWRQSNGFDAAWMRSPVGMSLSLGGGAAIVAFAIGVGVMRPAALKVFALMPVVQQLAEGPEREARTAEMQGYRQRAATSARWVASLLLLAVIGMAVARYL